MITTLNNKTANESVQFVNASETTSESDLNLKEHNKIVLTTRLGFILITCKDIVRAEANRAYCNFHLKDGTKLRASRSLKFYESKLREWNFIKVHKSFMVNLTHVEGYIKGKSASLVLSDNSMVPVSIRKKHRLHRVFVEQPELFSVQNSIVA